MEEKKKIIPEGQIVPIRGMCAQKFEREKKKEIFLRLHYPVEFDIEKEGKKNER